MDRKGHGRKGGSSILYRGKMKGSEERRYLGYLGNSKEASMV